jgi:hypothetical protein
VDEDNSEDEDSFADLDPNATMVSNTGGIVIDMVY